MSFVLVTEEWLNAFKQEVITEIRNLNGNQSTVPKVVKSGAAMKMLQCSDSKLASLRVSGKLPTHKVGATYYYNTSDIEKLLAGGF